MSASRLCSTGWSVGARRSSLLTPGVTRDRREGWARIGPLRFRAIDTAGLEEAAPETLAGRMMAQTERALEEADAALLLIDGRAGVTPADEFFANQLRRLHVPIVLAVNKCEGGAAEGGIAESHYALGLGQPIPISAEHGEGLADLYNALSPFDSEADGRWRRRGRRAPARHRGTPQRRQVDAAQPAGGRGAGHHRRGARAHAGLDRRALVLRGPRWSSLWIPRACAAGPRPWQRSTSSPRGMRSVHSARRRWCSSSSTLPTPPAVRTWRSPRAWPTKAAHP